MTASMASCRVANFFPYRLAVFNHPQKLSVGASWHNPNPVQQLSFLFIEEHIFQPLSAFWNSCLQYWLTRTNQEQPAPLFLLSLWNINPAAGRRRKRATVNASLTRLVCMCSFMLQPTTYRLNRSITAAKFTQPSSVAMSVMSPLQS